MWSAMQAIWLLQALEYEMVLLTTWFAASVSNACWVTHVMTATVNQSNANLLSQPPWLYVRHAAATVHAC